MVPEETHEAPVSEVEDASSSSVAAALLSAAARLAKAVALAIADARRSGEADEGKMDKGRAGGLGEGSFETEDSPLFDEVADEVETQRRDWNRDSDGVDTHVRAYLDS